MIGKNKGKNMTNKLESKKLEVVSKDIFGMIMR